MSARPGLGEGPPRLGLGVVLAAAAQISSMGLLLTSGWLIVRASQAPPVLYLLVAITSVRMFGVARAALRYTERLLTHDAVLERGARERTRWHRVLATAAPGGLAGPDRPHGDVVDTVVRDVETVQEAVLRVRLPWITTLAAAGVTVGVVAIVSVPAGCALAGATAVALLLVRAVVPRLARSSAPRLSGEATALVRAAPDLVAYGVGATAAHRLHDAIDALERSDRRSARARGTGTALVAVATAGSVALVASVAQATGLSGPAVGVVLLAPVGLLDLLETVVEAEQRRPGVAAARTRLAALDALTPRWPEPAVTRRADPPRDATLELDSLVVGWDQALTEPLSTRIAPGERVAVTGASGVGKSTLAATLERFTPPVSGRVLLGGVDLARLTGADVRATVGWLGQDAAVFDTTMRENLRIGDPGADDAAVWAALERAGLGATVRGWPCGLDTPVGEGGRLLSGGERQRVGLARLLLGGHRVLVLDEPTEHLDAATAEALLDDVLALPRDHTVLLITHLDAAAARCERVVRLRPSAARSPVAEPGALVV